MQTLKEINKIIEQKIKGKEITEIYSAIAHNPHLSFDMAVKLGAIGVTEQCDTYSGWNSKNVHIKRGEHSYVLLPLRTEYGQHHERYFTASQTDVKPSANKRTIESLFKHINGYSFMQIYAEKTDFSAICAAIKNYAEENNVYFNRADEQYVINGIASILVNTCADVDKIEIDQ